jgi:regulator of RNase E activity RraB
VWLINRKLNVVLCCVLAALCELNLELLELVYKRPKVSIQLTEKTNFIYYGFAKYILFYKSELIVC